MNLISTANRFRGVIDSITYGVTRNKQFPQAIIKFVADECEVDGEFTALPEPQELTAFLVLFNNDSEFSEATANFNYKNLKDATGWSGTEFKDHDPSIEGKRVTVTTKLDTYNGKTRAVVQFIDDEAGERTSGPKPLEASALQSLNARLKIGVGASRTSPPPARASAASVAKSSPKSSPAPTATTPPPAKAPPAKRSAKPAPPPPSQLTAPNRTGAPAVVETDEQKTGRIYSALIAKYPDREAEITELWAKDTATDPAVVAANVEKALADEDIPF